MSSPNYKAEDLKNIKDDYLIRKIDEHYRIERLVRANSGKLGYEVKAFDKVYPHPPIVYHIRYFIDSFIGIDEKQMPLKGQVHELRIRIPNIFPEQTVETKMLSTVWHPNIRFSGAFAGDICTNHKGFGSLYNLDELIIRIGEYLQFRRYLAEDRKPYPEDQTVAKWVREFAEPNGIIHKDKGIFTDNYAWNYVLDVDATAVEAEEEEISFTERVVHQEPAIDTNLIPDTNAKVDVEKKRISDSDDDFIVLDV